MKLTRKQIAVGAVALVVAGAAVVQMVWHPFGRTRALHARQVQLDLTYPDAEGGAALPGQWLHRTK